jgi:hypothetical protein
MTRFRYSGVNWEGRRWTTVAPITALGEQVEDRWDTRHPADGTVSSKTHDQNSPRSDHRPKPLTGPGVVRAIDLGVYLDQGERLYQELRNSRDPRIKYAIFQDRIFSSYDHANGPPYTERPYTGTPHNHHIHVSTLPSADDDGAAWDIGEGDMTAAVQGMQEELNTAGFTDMNGDPLDEDGKWGAKTQAAWGKMAKAADNELEDHTHDVARKTKGVS